MDGDLNAPLSIDLNADMGEGFGPYAFGADGELLHCVSSVNIACGFHAGDPATMRRTVRLALEHGAAIGAHPGLPDRLGFGRRAMEITPEEAYETVLYQIGALDAFVRAEGGCMTHVKPHGALYNMAARDERLALSISRAVRAFDPRLVLYGLSGSALIAAGEKAGIPTANEAFADRRYLSDGQLAPRRMPGSVITDTGESLAQVHALVRGEAVPTLDGEPVRLRADTLCIHGDTPHAVHMAHAVRESLTQAGVRIRPLRFPPAPDPDEKL